MCDLPTGLNVQLLANKPRLTLNGKLSLYWIDYSTLLSVPLQADRYLELLGLSCKFGLWCGILIVGVRSECRTAGSY